MLHWIWRSPDSFVWCKMTCHTLWKSTKTGFKNMVSEMWEWIDKRVLWNVYTSKCLIVIGRKWSLQWGERWLKLCEPMTSAIQLVIFGLSSCNFGTYFCGSFQKPFPSSIHPLIVTIQYPYFSITFWYCCGFCSLWQVILHLASNNHVWWPWKSLKSDNLAQTCS